MRMDDPEDAGTVPAARRRSRYEALYDGLKRTIVADGIKAGTVLLEGPLADLMGSSRAPVRQALKMLAQDGLLSRFEGRGFIVGSPDAGVRRVDLAQALGHLADDGGRCAFAWQSLYEDVERCVVNHSFFGRFRLNELELARYHGVGRTVARDLLLRLETLGIVEKDDSSRWSIVPLDARRIFDLYELREQLEPLALIRALDDIPDTEIDRMLARLHAALEVYPDVSPGVLYDLELDLHVRSIEPCPNKELLSVLQRTHCILTLSKHVLGVQLAMPDYEPFLAEHVAVFETMRRRDRDAVRLVMQTHIREAQPKVLERAQTVRETCRPQACSFIL